MNVSVLIATYGGSEWEDLAWSRAWPSARDQEPSELLCFHDPEGTIASVRNELGKQAKGEWLCFLDADDELAPGYLGAMGRAREQSGDGTWLLTPAVRKLHGKRPGIPYDDFYPEVSLTTGNWLIIGTLVQRSLFHEVGGFEDYPHGLEDWHLWAKCAKAGAQIVKVPEAIYIQNYSPRSKHWRLMRNRPEYMVHYEQARESVWG